MDGFEIKQDELIDFLLNLNHTASDNFAVDLISAKYPLSFEFMDRFQSNLNWDFVSRNSKIEWNFEYLKKYKSKINWTFLEYDKILANQDLDSFLSFFEKELGIDVNWYNLSNSKNISWKIELIDKHIKNWKWEILSTNISLPWSEEFLDYYKTKWSYTNCDDFHGVYLENIFHNNSIHWDKNLIKRYFEKIDWEGISSHKGLSWSIDLINEFYDYWDWKQLCGNEGIIWSKHLIEYYLKKIDWDFLSQNPKVTWSNEVIDLYIDKWSWKNLSKNEGINWSLPFFEKHLNKWDFDYLCKNPSFPWTEELIEKYIEKIDFYSFSSNRGFNWTEKFIDTYSDRVNWNSDDETGEYIGLEWNNLPWTIEFAKKHENDTVWINYAHGYENFYEKLIYPYINDSIVEKIFNSNNQNMKFVCLANSFKEGGRCLAGIELDSSNNPKKENGHPKWIRPICNTPHGEVHTHLVVHLKILDIIEIDVTGYPEVRDYQSENGLFRENSIRVLSRFNPDNLNKLCDNRNLIFGNRGKAVSEEKIGELSYSLMLINTNQFEVIERTYDDNPNRPQVRLVFSYNGNQYDLPITDPIFLHNYQTDPDIMEDVADIYLSLSLAVVHNHWHSKLVAGIIFQ